MLDITIPRAATSVQEFYLQSQKLVLTVYPTRNKLVFFIFDSKLNVFCQSVTFLEVGCRHSPDSLTSLGINKYFYEGLNDFKTSLVDCCYNINT